MTVQESGATPPASGLAPRLTIDVIELNPHAPRPFVFTEAALCLRDSIRASGLESNHRVNIADPRGICIVLGALPPHHEPLRQLDRRKALVFNFEQLGSTSSIAGPEYLQWLRQWLVLDYHSRNVDHLRRLHGPAQQVLELPIVPSPSLLLGPSLPADRCVDVLFFGSQSDRRTALLRQLEESGLRVETVAGAYGDELTPAIRRARLVLHIHYYETGLFPVARVLQPVVAGVPIVCESSVFSAGCDWSGSGIVFAPYEGLLEACRHLLSSEKEQQQRATMAREFAARIDFAGPFNQVLEALRQRLSAPEPGAEVQGGHDAETPLSTQQIEAILEREASELPPEANLQAPALKLAERQPGRGRYGRWIVALLVAFSLYTIWRSMQR